MLTFEHIVYEKIRKYYLFLSWVFFFIKVVKEVKFFSPLFLFVVKIMIYSLNEIYASGGQLPAVTLTIENEEIGELNFILAYEDKKIDDVLYHASAFTVQLPERSDSGFTDLAFSVCGVSGQCYDYVKRTLQSKATTYLTLRQWHPETEELLYSLKLTVTGGQLTRDAANFTASFCDMLNTEFPKLRYTTYNAPGLKYVA